MIAMQKIDKITIHCSDSRWGDVNEIRRWHKERGWDDIGYHFVISNAYPNPQTFKNGTPLFRFDGLVQMGRDIGSMGAHVRGHNAGNVGICLIGVDQFTAAQFDALEKLVTDICKEHHIGHEQVYGHYEFDPGKTCPNLNMPHLRNLLFGPETGQ